VIAAIVDQSKCMVGFVDFVYGRAERRVAIYEQAATRGC